METGKWCVLLNFLMKSKILVSKIVIKKWSQVGTTGTLYDGYQSYPTSHFIFLDINIT